MIQFIGGRSTLEDETAMLSPNVGHQTPNVAAQYPKRTQILTFLALSVWWTLIYIIPLSITVRIMKWWSDLWIMFSTEVYPASSTVSTRADFVFLFMMCFIKGTYIYFYERISPLILLNSCLLFIKFKTCVHVSHTSSLFVLGGRGSVSINVYEIQGSHSDGNRVVVFWVVILRVCNVVT